MKIDRLYLNYINAFRLLRKIGRMIAQSEILHSLEEDIYAKTAALQLNKRYFKY